MRISGEEIEKIISEKITAITLKKNISPQHDLIEQGILTSVTIMELAVALEKEFGISFSFMEITRESFSSVLSIRAVLLKKLS